MSIMTRAKEKISKPAREAAMLAVMAMVIAILGMLIAISRTH